MKDNLTKGMTPQIRRALDRIQDFCDMGRDLEVEMGVRHDVERGNFPHSWWSTLKKLNWDAEKFKDEFLKEIQDGSNNENVQGSSGDGEDTPSDLPDPECGYGHLANDCPEGCAEGECKHPRTD